MICTSAFSALTLFVQPNLHVACVTELIQSRGLFFVYLQKDGYTEHMAQTEFVAELRIIWDK